MQKQQKVDRGLKREPKTSYYAKLHPDDTYGKHDTGYLVE
jgi:hypothetical protein